MNDVTKIGSLIMEHEKKVRTVLAVLDQANEAREVDRTALAGARDVLEESFEELYNGWHALLQPVPA